MSKTQKLIVTILIISVLYTILCFPVSANYVDMLDHGLYYTNSYYPLNLIDSGGAGSGISDSVSLVPMWALDSYEMGKTYTFVFSCTLSSSVYNHINTAGVYLNTSNKPRTSIVRQEHLSKAYRSISYDTTTKKATFTVKLNTDIVDLGGYPIYIYFYAPYTDGTNYVTVTTGAWSTYVETDSGGSDYVQSLVDEVSQIRQNQDTYYTSAQETLDAIKKNSDELPENIRQILEERDQKEKQEGMSQTEEGIASITESLTNLIPVSSVIDSIKPIYNACTFEGTQSIWTLPSITLPKIDGVMEETTISNEIQFDMVEFADRFIPDDILSLVRSVNGIGIVVFSVYEVISLINQVINGNFNEEETEEQ